MASSSECVEEQEDSDEYFPNSHPIQQNLVHNPQTPWNLMKPILREKYESLEQLKFCLTNYAVSNGYQLYYDRCDKTRLVVRCGKDKKGSSQCTFRLRASWMRKERRFQIKRLEKKHVCTRSRNFGSILNSKWIAKHYVKDLIANPRMKPREIQEDVLKRFLCDVSLHRCFNAKHIAMTMINEKGLSTKRKRRATEENEDYTSGRNVKCKNCLQRGHNMKFCKKPKQNQDPKVNRKRGRPRIHEPVMRASRGGENGGTCLGRKIGTSSTKREVVGARHKIIQMASSSECVEEQEDSDEYFPNSHPIQQNPVHNPQTPWNLMKPILREKYESLEQLKFCLTNYAVSNGYQLYYDRCDKTRLVVRCGKDKKGSSQCTFRLRASWMRKERRFQIKRLEKKHVCTRSRNFGSILNSKWIAKHYVKDLIANPRMKPREIQEDVPKRFLCDVSLRRCYNAKHIAMTMINEKGLSTKRKRRATEEDEDYTSGRNVTCKNCLQRDHNMKSCKNPKQNQDPKVKRKRGRPRIHERVMKASRGGKDGGTCLGRKTGTPSTKKEVVGARHKGFVAETKESEDIVCETEGDKTQEIIKTMIESGYTSAEIEETLAVEEEEGMDETQPTVCVKNPRRSERIVKIKLSSTVYDEDGGGSCVEKAITLD